MKKEFILSTLYYSPDFHTTKKSPFSQQTLFLYFKTNILKIKY